MPTERALTIGLVAGESSGDNLGAALIRAIRAVAPETRFVGVAGPAMRAEGCDAWAESHELAVMGLFEVLHHLPRLLRLRRVVLRRMRTGWGLVVIAVVGLALVAALFGSSTRRSIAEMVGWSLALGCGAVAMILIWTSMIGFKPTRAIVLCIGTVGATTLIVLVRDLDSVFGRLKQLGAPVVTKGGARLFACRLPIS